MSNPSLLIQEICKNYAPSSENNIWKELLFAMLPFSPHPLLASPSNNVSAAAIWSYLRVWKETFRKAKAQKGDRIMIALDPGPAWVIVFLSALWEDLTIFLCDPLEIGHTRREDFFAVISSDPGSSTWTVDENLEPQMVHHPNVTSSKNSNYRIQFSKNSDEFTFTDEKIISFLSRLNCQKKGEAVLSTLDFSSPIGFFYDFLHSFFLYREIFFTQKNKEHEIERILSTFEIDHLVCDLEQVEDYKKLKEKSKNNKPFVSFAAFAMNQDTKDLLLFLDRDFSFSQKRKSSI